MRGKAGLFLLLPLLLTSAPARAAEPVTVSATPIRAFQGASAPGERVGPLIWRGGIVMESDDPRFGGLSGLGFLGPDGRLVMVSDRGNFVFGRLTHDAGGAPDGLADVGIAPIRNSRGAPLPAGRAADAEALDVVLRDGAPVAVRVGFENLTRVADFTLLNGVPGGPAREINLPDWLRQARSNETIESVCIAPPASPVAGSTLVISEGISDEKGRPRGALLGVRDRGPLSYAAGPATRPTDCAFLPNGDLLVLERGIALLSLSFSMRLRLVPAHEVRPDAVLTGQTLLEVVGRDIDNMESVAVYTAPDGETRIAIGSDNNFNGWERQLILTFALAP
jgi:hypothetical protein